MAGRKRRVTKDPSSGDLLVVGSDLDNEERVTKCWSEQKRCNLARGLYSYSVVPVVSRNVQEDAGGPSKCLLLGPSTQVEAI